jgi:hypothetical protein
MLEVHQRRLTNMLKHYTWRISAIPPGHEEARARFELASPECVAVGVDLVLGFFVGFSLGQESETDEGNLTASHCTPA